MTIESDVQKLDLGTIVELFSIDFTPIGTAAALFFHAGVNSLEANVVWQGQEYTKWPMSCDGFELSGKGVLPKPEITVSNIDGTISALCKQYQDMVGAKVIRKKTHLKYLDAVNFQGGVNPSADPDQHYRDEVWQINRKTAQNPVFATFELSASWDVQKYKLPGRTIVRNLCSWTYRSAECSYAGASYFDLNDNPVGTIGQDVCAKRIRSCKIRFGEFAVLPWGGFALST